MSRGLGSVLRCNRKEVSVRSDEGSVGEKVLSAVVVSDIGG